MSTIVRAGAAAQSVGRQSRAGGMTATFKRWWVAYITWRVEQEAIKQLWSMSDRELDDIGLTRSEITGAVRHSATD